MKILSNISVLFSLIGIFASSSVTQADNTTSIHSSHPLKESEKNFMDCNIGLYGAFCDSPCNCRDNVACDSLTGHCPDGCALGFKGPICNVCADGFFGTHCNGTCHCLQGHAACNQTSGYCDGGCAIGYSDPACQNLTGFPQILSISNDDIVNVASTILVVCTAWGAPDPNITLISKNFTLVEGSTGDYNLDDKKNFYASFQTSNTTGVSQLMCTAVNEHGAVNLTFRITTVDPPELKLPPTTGIITAENVSLTWTPWQFGVDKGGAQHDVPEYMVVYRSLGGLNWSPGSNWSVNNFATVEHLIPDSDYQFAIRSKRDGDGGEGPIGQIAQAFTKCRAPTENGKPLNLTATVKSATTVYFQWKAPSLINIGCSLSKYNLSCGVNGSTSSVVADISGFELSYEMVDLQPNSTYICFMYGITSVSNLGFHFAEVSFHTPNPVPGPVQHLFKELFASGSRNSLIKWAHPKNLPDRAVQEYLVTAELLTVNSCGGVPPETNVTNFTTTTNTTQVNLINMYPFSTYQITLRALSNDGQLGEETNLTMETMQDVPDVKPPKVSSVTENSATVTFYWDPIPCEKANGKVSYKYSLHSTDEEKIRRRKRSSDYVIKDKETNGTNVTIAGLNLTKTYEFAVRGFTMAGEGPLAIIQKRPENVSFTPDLAFHNATQSTAFVEIITPKKTGDKIVGFQLKIQKENDSGSVEEINLEAHQISHLITELSPYTTYTIQCRAKVNVSSSEWSEWSKPKLLRTDEGVPMAPDNLLIDQLNATAVNVLWQPPVITNGIIQHYQVLVFNLSESDSVKYVKPLMRYRTPNSYSTNVTLNGLEPERIYEIQVMASTRVGYGEARVRNFTMEKTEVTAAPNIVKYKIHNSSAVYVQWEAPEYVSDTIIKYKVEFQLLSAKSPENQNSSGSLFTVETPNNSTLDITYNGLLAEMTYMLSVVAETVDGYSKADSRNFTMAGENDSRKVVDILLPPPPPVITKIISHESDPSEIEVVVKLFPSKSDSWSPLSDHEVVVAEEGYMSNLNESKIFDYYYAKEHDVPFWIAARLSPKFFSSDSNQEFVVGDKKTYNSFYNGPLRADKKYYIMTRAVGSMPASTSYLSPMASVAAKDEPESVFGPCIVWGISCIWFLLIVIIFLFLFWVILAFIICYQRRKRHGKQKVFKNDNKEDVYGKTFASNKEEEVSPLTVFVQSPDDHAKTDTFKTSDFFGPILLKNLADYIIMRAYHPNLKFQEEFMQATRNKELNAPWNISKKAANLKKNRYGNILPFDQTRVQLEPLPGLPDSDYINASFIDGYDKPKTYIATQGPKENTFHDFWRMIWQERVTVIVMLTALIEHKKRKCDQYWPNQSRLFGDILVSLTETEHLADIVIRRFEMKLVGNTDIRHVTHYHFSDWPDLGIPPCVTAVLQLRREVREDLPLNSGPIVVHCSGGAGRTGTFIAIDAMLKQAYDEERVYVYDYVHRIQSQRVHLIQTPDQYRFVYDAILEAVQSGDTKVLCSRLPIYYRDISRTSETEPSDLAEQFNILSELEQRKSSFPYPEALNEENLCKNRNQNILPIEHSRVRLLSENGRGSTQNPTEPYINAVLCDGFKQKGQFLVTQMPLDCTIEDFWHMVVRHRSSVIVMLNDCEFIDEHIMPGQYWPNDGCTLFGPFQIEVVAFEEKGMVNCRTLRVLDTRKPDSEPQCVMQLQFLGWAPGDMVPSSTASVVSLLNMTDVLQRKYGGPITIHCTDGASRSGLFCVSHVLKEQIELGEVDIFTAVKRLRRHRPQFITSLEQYQFCYEVAIELNSGRTDDSESKMITTSI